MSRRWLALVLTMMGQSHPKIVVVHLRDAVRTMSERGASFLKRGDHHCDVRTAKIDAALCFEVGRVICFLEEQTYSRTVKERQVIEPIQFRNVHNLNLKAAYEQAGAIVGKKPREASAAVKPANPRLLNVKGGK